MITKLNNDYTLIVGNLELLKYDFIWKCVYKLATKSTKAFSISSHLLKNEQI